ncbi:MAG TPA: Ppx/GppA phosphatase family protein [Blastocatellia bacterium]|nr:Ppx/GppA phosphatase family protein [Blastocatellia bacterium]
MKLATIDIGSNSIHLLIVEVDQDGHFRPIDREREMVRLGSHGLTVGHLAPDAVERALAALARYADLARAHGCERIIATATSAVREADNGDKFVRRVKRRTGIEVDILSGIEEARLISRSVSSVRDLGDVPTLGIDIGGGSTEFWVLERGETRYLVSNRLGSVRLTDGFVHDDPLSQRDRERLRGYIIGTLARTRREIEEVGFERVILTSGTALTLAQMGYESERAPGTTEPLPPEDTQGIELTADCLRRITKQITRMPVKERRRMPGLPPERADIIVAGALLLDTIYSELGIERAVTCDWALREGILVDFLERTHPQVVSSRDTAGSPLEMGEIRRRSILALAKRCEYDASHAMQTTRLAKSIFDQTRQLHGYGRNERELLEVAAVLHDIGYTISHAFHNRHAQYLILNSELVGFSARELAIVGNVVRYHGGRGPKKKDEGYARLRPDDRRMVRRLTAILTVADALDRSSRATVRTVDVQQRNSRVRFHVSSESDCHLELWDARRKAGLFERAFRVRTEFVEASTDETGSTGDATGRRQPASSST